MAEEFNFEILTPGRSLVSARVTEVVLPSFDGETGILAKHGDFIGLLGTGALKMVREGNDYWYLVSSGVYEVRDGKLTVLADVGEEASEVDVSAASAGLKDAEAALEGASSFAEDFAALKVRAEREKGRLEVHRRTESLH